MLRFLYSLIALALVLSPLGMSQTGMAMAHGAAAETAMAEGHCNDTEAPADEDQSSKAMLDCMGICSAIAAGEEASTARHVAPAAGVVAPRLNALSGLHPESEPPPPRIS